MPDTATVTVGLDVHRASVRLAALRADELLDECTLPNDPVAVGRALARWPQVLCCYEAGPTGFGLYRHLVERGIDCRVVAPGLVPNLPGERIKTDARDARKLARLLAGGLLEPIWVPSPELEGARDLVRAREDARLDRMRDRHRLSKFCLRHGRPLPGASWGGGRRKWLADQRFPFEPQQRTFNDYLHAVDLRRPPHRSARRRDPRNSDGRALGAAGREAALPARNRHPDRIRARSRDRRLPPLRLSPTTDGLRRPRALRTLLRPANTADKDQSPKPATATSVDC